MSPLLSQFEPLGPLLRRKLGAQGDHRIQAPVQELPLQHLDPLAGGLQGDRIGVLLVQKSPHLDPRLAQGLDIRLDLVPLRVEHIPDLLGLLVSEAQPLLEPVPVDLPNRLAIITGQESLRPRTDAGGRSRRLLCLGHEDATSRHGKNRCQYQRPLEPFRFHVDLLCVKTITRPCALWAVQAKPIPSKSRVLGPLFLRPGRVAAPALRPAFPFLSQGLELRLLPRVQQGSDATPGPLRDLLESGSDLLPQARKLLAGLAEDGL